MGFSGDGLVLIMDHNESLFFVRFKIIIFIDFKVGEAQATRRKAQELSERLSLTIKKQDEMLEEWNDTIANKLIELRNQITKTHHIAESVSSVQFYR